MSDQRQTIMIVDDEPGSIGVFMRALLGDYRVVFAKSGPEALSLAARERPDLIILDVVMPGMNGYDVYRALKRDEALASAPVIFLTSRDDEADERIGLQLGAVDYWTKPVSVEIARIRARNHLELKRHRDLLTKLAATDELCNIANRRGFDQVLAREWRRCGRSSAPLSLILLDIDHFKAYNDHYGHPAGDACLRRVAAAIAGALARPADLAARYGGEEFACILPETDQTGAARIAESVRKAVEAAMLPHDHSEFGTVTVSLGAATLIPTPGNPEAGLIDQADRALYRAKENGRNQVRVWGMD